MTRSSIRPRPSPLRSRLSGSGRRLLLRAAALLMALLVLGGNGSLRGESDHAQDDAFWADAAALLPGFDGRPAAPRASDLDGRWSALISWPHIPVSAASLPNGKILTFAGQERTMWPGTKTQTYWTLYDPESERFDENLYLDHEMFCAHLVMRADGRVQTSGGRYTVEDSSVFDFRANTWGRVGDMGDPRWYATSVALPEGDVFAAAGSGGPNTAERFSVRQGQWSKLNGINWQPISGAEGFESHWWPYLFLAPDGRIFHFGPTETMHWVDPSGNGSLVSAGLNVPNQHYPKHAAVAMYASGKILIAGGASELNGGSSNLCYTVDLNTSPPTVKQVASMQHRRRFANAVVLPTGEVLVAGGNTSGRKFSDLGSILTPEIWNPTSDRWRAVADIEVPRNYHSVGLLLADGRVFLGGGGFASHVPDHPASHQDAQIYTPPALFTSSGRLADRPLLQEGPDSVTCGAVFTVKGSPGLARFAAIRLLATTHGLSTDQRYLNLPFSESTSGQYQLVAHPNPNVMVPGYWMLFGVAANGTYSRALTVQVNAPGNAAASGLQATYFADADLTQARFQRVDPNVDFRYGSGSPDLAKLGPDDYSIRWQGWIVPDQTGPHHFQIDTLERARLWIDGQSIVDQWDRAAPGSPATVTLTGGQPVSLTLEFSQKTQEARIRLLWSPPGGLTEVIPQRHLRHAHPAGTAAIEAQGRFELYVDGQLALIGAGAERRYYAAFSAASASGLTIAIRARQESNPRSLAAALTLDDEAFFSGSEWKVSTSPAAGWQEPGFDDRSWASATVVPARTGSSGIPNASHVWAADPQAAEVFLRRTLGGLRLLSPEPEVAFAGDFVRLPIEPRTDPSQGEEPLAWSAENLPPGLAIDPQTGVISGTLTQASRGNHQVTVEARPAPPHSPARVTFTWRILGKKILTANFTTDAGGFLYEDDVFRSTRAPAEAHGRHLTQDPGVLQVTLGDASRLTTAPMSGGWSTGFTLPSPQPVDITLRYQLQHHPASLNAGASQALLAVDGRLVGVEESDALAILSGDAAIDTGWRSASVSLGVLAAGRHSLTVGAFAARDNAAAGVTTLRVDDVWLTSDSPPNQPPSLPSALSQEHTAGTALTLRLEGSDPDGDSLSFSAEDLPPGLNLQADTGVISGVPRAAGSHRVTLTVTDGTHTLSQTFSWRIHPPLSIPEVLTAPVSAGDPVSFTASASGGTRPLYSWNFGDGTSDSPWSSSPAITHRYPSPGRYPVTFTARDASGAEASIALTQNVTPEPVGDHPTLSQPLCYQERAGNDHLWAVNPDQNTVTLIDVDAELVLAEIPLPEHPRSLALNGRGELWITCKDAAVIWRLRTGDRRALSPIVFPPGSEPHGLAFDPQKKFAYLTLEGLGQVLQLDAATGMETARLASGPHPRHLSVSPDGQSILVSRFITPPVPGEASASPDVRQGGGEVLLLRPSPFRLDKMIRLQHSDEPDSGGAARGLPNYLGPACISPAGDMAWVPSKQDNILRGRLRDGQDLTFESTLRAVSSRIDLLNAQEDYPARLDHDDAAVASTAIFDRRGLYVFVALEGSQQVAVLDAYGQQELLRFEVGHAPQGLALSPDGDTLFVHNFLSRTVSTHQIGALTSAGKLQVDEGPVYATVSTESLHPDVLLGKRLFYDARDPRLSRESYMSCASCHHDGGHDGRVWDMTGLGEGLRNTIDLRGRGGLAHGPLHWSANFDEVQDFERQIRQLSGGSGLLASSDPHPPLGTGNAGRSRELDALAAYLTSLTKTLPSPYRAPDGSLTALAREGREVFRTQGCAECHSGTQFTDSHPSHLGHAIGTLRPSSGNRLGQPLGSIDTPTLRALWNGAPYLHDGSALTLEAALVAHRDITLASSQTSALTAYLTQIDAWEPEAPTHPPAPSELADRLGNPQLPSPLRAPSSSALTVPYTSAGENREIAVWLRASDDPSSVHGHATTAVSRGPGVATLSLNLGKLPIPGASYVWDIRLLPLGWQSPNDALDRLEIPASIYQSPNASPSAGDTVRFLDPLPVISPAEVTAAVIRYQAAGPRRLEVALLIAGDVPEVLDVRHAVVPPGADILRLPLRLPGPLTTAANLRWRARLYALSSDDNPDVLAEVERVASLASAPGQPLINLARLPRSSASQSRTLAGAAARLARDGNPDGDWRHGSVSLTGLDTHAWWQIDLGGLHDLSHLLLWHREDPGTPSSGRLSVFVSQTAFPDLGPAQLRALPGVTEHVLPASGTPWQRVALNQKGRHVRVQLAGSGYLGLAEVEIFGRGASPPHGLTYHYFEGVWGPVPSFTGLRPLSAGTTLSLETGMEPARPSHYGVRYRADLVIPREGSYLFRMRGQTAARLLLRGETLVSHRMSSSTANAQESRGSISLAPGSYPFTLETFVGDGGATPLTLTWEGPGLPRQSLPPDAFLLPHNQPLLESSPPPAEIDGDLLNLAAELGLGNDPASGAMLTAPLALQVSPTGQDHRVDAVFRRPTRLAPLKYTLEVSTDHEHWMALDPRRAQVRSESHAWEAVTYTGIDGSHASLAKGGFARLRIEHLGWNTHGFTPVQGWTRTLLKPGIQTHGASLNHPAVFAGILAPGPGGDLIVSGSGLTSVLHAGTAYYAEIISGEHEGHRLQVAPERCVGPLLAIDWLSPDTTLTVPPGAEIEGAQVLVRPHRTLGEIYPVETFTSGKDPSRADQIQFLATGHYDTYFALQGGGLHHWTSASQTSLQDAGNEPVYPGKGAFIHRPPAATPLELIVVGEIRSTAFVQPLSEGYQLLATPNPLLGTPRQWGMIWETGFRGGRDPAATDQLQFWLGDAVTGHKGYQAYFLLDGGQPARRHWTAVDSTRLGNEDDALLFSPDRAFFFKGQTARPDFRIPASPRGGAAPPAP